ncbi:hypothetical protein GCM10009772_38770 [Pseudonocardia alni subsp. carboxydivorans]
MDRPPDPAPPAVTAPSAELTMTAVTRGRTGGGPDAEGSMGTARASRRAGDVTHGGVLS